MNATESAAELALDTAESLRDPHIVTQGLTRAMAASLCDGLAGTALLHACLSRHEPRSAAVASLHWESAAQLTKQTRPAGIHTGQGGLAASLIIGAGHLPNPERHRASASRAASWLSARAEALADHQRQRSAQAKAGAPWAVYDAINGLSGIGRVLLAAHQAGHHTARRGLDAALATLTGILNNSSGTRPGWWLPASEHAPTVGVHSTGAATTGLAHGIAGPISLLTSAAVAGIEVAGQQQAIRRGTKWLTHWQEETGSWPPFISGEALDDTRHYVTRPGRRNAWCYGSPGIAVTLKRAGTLTRDDEAHAAADRATASLASIPRPSRDTEGPTVCHGSSGILHAARRLGVMDLANDAAEQTMEAHDADLQFGFPHVEAGTRADRPGFLTGAAGVAIALADYGKLIPETTTTPWDAVLLLA
ncbi:lanthionine synthetase C family protein [Streptomyces sp. JJ38]|uniref:lanthionine synthetase C family protein n=1 Tax=Streptomyces sp. JJ38 TaxID=2738128 RepID=UPI001C5A063B|nr:lanthionine synthetase C family protein [Streptomyces sp. JJ38]MBW1599428.1 lanthionine synthetase C family protein [Streptomyces sp. JJ38]